MSERLTIGELARATGVQTSALRYWEELGLLPAPERVSGQRRYPRSAVERVGMVLVFRDVGFTLREIHQVLTDPVGWRELHKRKLAELDERISRAQAARTAVAHAVACPHPDGLFHCDSFTAVVAQRLAGSFPRAQH